ncbi:TPA: hypothetical protein LA460_000133 [Clostridium botulinum]|nr:hypothetical protein [Clostridium botulinum]HBJ1652738.1 hypothetical protein [Clostridium botulinum]
MLNKTMCLLSLSLLFTTSTVNTKPMFVAEQSIEKINLKEMVQTDLKNELLMNKLRVHNGEKTSIQLYIEEQERIRLEAEKQKKLKEERLKQEEENEWKEFELTFYTSLNCENGYGAKTCNNKPLSRGIVANNHYRQYTKLYLEGYGEVTVADKGSNKHFNNDFRLDVFVPRNNGENDSEYLNRVNNIGRQKVKGKIIK